MIIAKVVGSVVATRKNDNLVGHKLMIVEPIDKSFGDSGRFVSIDNVGAGIGETVLVALCRGAAIGCDFSDAPVDAAIVGIVDSINET